MQLVVDVRSLRHVVPKAVSASLRNSRRDEAIDAMGVPASKRLRRPSDFLKVRSEGIRFLCGPFIFQARDRQGVDGSGCRFGVIASRRVGNAVVRQRAKRIFREIFRRNESVLPEGCDIVVVVRHSFARHPFADLEQRYLKACGNLIKARGKTE